MILYKYLPPERLDVLERHLIRYTQPGAFNDPFEARPYINSISESPKVEDRIDEILMDEAAQMYERLEPQIKANLPFEVLVDLVKARREDLRGHFGKLVNEFTPLVRRAMEEKFNELLGIMSLTEDPKSLLMWSHYAKSHEGYVIGFDTTHPYFNAKRSKTDEFNHVRKIIYRDARPNKPLTELDGIEVFLVKGSDWSYEREWRIMRPLSDSAQTFSGNPLPIHLFDYPKDAIAEVIMGARMNPQDKLAVRHIAADSESIGNFVICESQLSESEFRVQIRKIAI